MTYSDGTPYPAREPAGSAEDVNGSGKSNGHITEKPKGKVYVPQAGEEEFHAP